MNADVLTTKVADGIAVITLGSAKRIYFDAEMGDALTEALDGFAGDANVRVVVVTGGAPGYFIRHFSVVALIRLAESLGASGREWPENATYNGGFFDKAMALCESMPKPVIAAISGTALAGAFEFALSCDLRIAEDGDYLIGLPEAHLGLLPGAGGTQRLPRIIGMPGALMHILMGNPLNPREAEKKGLVHETVSGKALDRAMEIARRLSLHPPEAVAYIKRLVRNATETPLAEGLALERNLFLKLCISEPALARIGASPSLRVVVFESANPEFYLAHFDLTGKTGNITTAVGPSGLPILIDTFVRITRSPVASIAKIRGCVRGVSSEFVLACDMRFASRENTLLGQPEVGVGVHPGGGGTERLPPLVGRGRALEIVLGANDFDGDTAAQYGYVNRALSDEELDGFVDALARRIATFDGRAIAAAKRLINQVSLPSADNLLSALNSFQTALTWPETLQRVEALLKQGLQQDRNFERQWPAMLDSLLEK